MKEILINSTSLEVRAAIVEEGELVEFMVERAQTRRLVGDVYLGRVNAILPGIQAAFVDIGYEKAGFLHASDLVPDTENFDMEGGVDIEDEGPRRGRDDRNGNGGGDEGRGDNRGGRDDRNRGPCGTGPPCSPSRRC
jgi:ribonuclease G